jgi:hypothetical protein
MTSSPQTAPIAELLGKLGRWACLVGPQAAGKTVYSQYLEKYSAGDKHHWSLRAELAQAAGRLTFSQITTSRRQLIADVVSPRTADPRRFRRAAGTKDLVIFEATSKRAKHSLTEIHFFDVPGEAVGHPHLPDLRQVLMGTRAVAMFVPVWGLLPGGWLKGPGYSQLYAPLPQQDAADPLVVPSWGTSLHADLYRGTPEQPIEDPEGLRRSQFAEAVDLLGKHVEQWCNLLLELVPVGSDLLIVLSQFQKEPFEGLFNSYFQSQAGSEVWKQYDDLLGGVPRDAAGASLATVTQKLQRTSAIGRDLLARVSSQAGNLPEAGAAEVCQTLLRFYRPMGAVRRGEQAELNKFRSVSVLPLNVVAIRTQSDWDLWSGEDQDATSLAEMRMCEDLLWWILLHQRGHEIWRW